MGMMYQPIVGTVMKSRTPVNLLVIVWGKQNRLMMIKDDIWLKILMMTIIPAQIHSHEGIDIVGSNWMAQQATNNKSAMLSRIDPVLLSAWSLLANQPSTMSLRPQRTYSVQNIQPFILQNSKPIEPAILSAVMMFGKCFTQINLVCVKICDFGWNHKISSCSNRAERVIKVKRA